MKIMDMKYKMVFKTIFEKKAGEKMSYNYDIDGISGATVSAKSCY